MNIVLGGIGAISVVVAGFYLLDDFQNRSKRNVSDMCMNATVRTLYAWDVMAEMKNEGEDMFDDLGFAEYYMHQPLNEAFRISLTTSRSDYEAAGKMLARCLNLFHKSCGEECLPNPNLWSKF